MSYDWTTHKPDGHVDRSINFGSGTLHFLLEAMRAHQLLDEQTPMPDWRDARGSRFRGAVARFERDPLSESPANPGVQTD